MRKHFAYYNEFDPKAAAWLRELIRLGEIMDGEVDERSITEVRPDDLKGYTRIGFFAGIGGWDLALRKVGWPEDRPVWHGSCPCQAFSCAGQQKGFADERDLWPVFFNLIRECRPELVLGEQVKNAVKFGWLDRLYADLEGEGYACGSPVLGAHSAGADHIRQRIYWVADAQRAQEHEELGRPADDEAERSTDGTCGCGVVGGMGDTAFDGPEMRAQLHGELQGQGLVEGREPRRLGNPEGDDELGDTLPGTHRQGFTSGRSGGSRNFWSYAVPHLCKDGKYRRFEPSVFEMAYVVSTSMGHRGASGVPRNVSKKTLNFGFESDNLMGFGDRKGNDNAAETQSGAATRVFVLQNGNASQEISGGRLGGSLELQKTQILQSDVHGEMARGQNKETERQELSSSIREAEENRVREMRVNGTVIGTSCGLESAEQRPFQLEDFVRTLPYGRALDRLAADQEASDTLQNLRNACTKVGNVSETLSTMEEVWRSLSNEEKQRVWMEVGEGKLAVGLKQVAVGIHPLAHGLPRGMGYSGDPRLPEYVNSTAEARVMRLKGYGNSVCVETAAMFVRAVMDELEGKEVIA